MSESSMLFEHDEPRPHLVELKVSAKDVDRVRRFKETRLLLHRFDPQQVGFGIADIVIRLQNPQVEE